MSLREFVCVLCAPMRPPVAEINASNAVPHHTLQETSERCKEKRTIRTSCILWGREGARERGLAPASKRPLPTSHTLSQPAGDPNPSAAATSSGYCFSKNLVNLFSCKCCPPPRALVATACLPAALPPVGPASLSTGQSAQPQPRDHTLPGRAGVSWGPCVRPPLHPQPALSPCPVPTLITLSWSLPSRLGGGQHGRPHPLPPLVAAPREEGPRPESQRDVRGTCRPCSRQPGGTSGGSKVPLVGPTPQPPSSFPSSAFEAAVHTASHPLHSLPAHSCPSLLSSREPVVPTRARHGARAGCLTISLRP